MQFITIPHICLRLTQRPTFVSSEISKSSGDSAMAFSASVYDSNAAAGRCDILFFLSNIFEREIK